MKNLIFIFLLLLGFFSFNPKSFANKDTPTDKISADAVVCYETVPDAPVSQHFVSEILINGKWCKSATLETECGENEKLKPYIRPNFSMIGCTMNRTSFEIPKGKSVQLHIKRIDGLPFDNWWQKSCQAEDLHLDVKDFPGLILNN